MKASAMSFSVTSLDAGMRCSNAAAMDAVAPMCSAFMGTPFAVGGDVEIPLYSDRGFPPFPHHVAAAHSRDPQDVRTEDVRAKRSGGRWASLRSGIGSHGLMVRFFCPAGVHNPVQRMSPDLKTYEVPLSQGKVALVSGADFDAISAVKWHAVLCSNRWYARRSVKTNGRGVPIYMHRQLLGLGPADRDTVVDHRNGDGLDNQRSNIRIATYGQNNLNIPAARGRSGFRCVYPQDGRFMVRVAGDYLGIFETAVEAAFHANQGLDAVSPGVGFRNDIDRAALLEILLQRQSSLAALIARVNEGSV